MGVAMEGRAMAPITPTAMDGGGMGVDVDIVGHVEGAYFITFPMLFLSYEISTTKKLRKNLKI